VRGCTRLGGTRCGHTACWGAAAEAGGSSTKNLPVPRLDPPGAPALAMPSGCPPQSRSALRGAQKGWHAELGFRFPAAWRLGAECGVVPVETRLLCFVPSPFFLSRFCLNSSSLYFAFFLMTPSSFLPADKQWISSPRLPSLILFYAFLAYFRSSAAVPSRGCVMNWHNISYFQEVLSLGQCADGRSSLGFCGGFRHPLHS